MITLHKIDTGLAHNTMSAQGFKSYLKSTSEAVHHYNMYIDSLGVSFKTNPGILTKPPDPSCSLEKLVGQVNALDSISTCALAPISLIDVDKLDIRFPPEEFKYLKELSEKAFKQKLVYKKELDRRLAEEANMYYLLVPGPTVPAL